MIPYKNSSLTNIHTGQSLINMFAGWILITNVHVHSNRTTENGLEHHEYILRQYFSSIIICRWLKNTFYSMQICTNEINSFHWNTKCAIPPLFYQKLAFLVHVYTKTILSSAILVNIIAPKVFNPFTPKSDQLQCSLSVSHQRYIMQYGEFGNT